MILPELTSQSENMTRPGYVHLSFGVGSRLRVDRLTERLKERGCEVIGGQGMTGSGYYEVPVAGNGGHVIEITE